MAGQLDVPNGHHHRGFKGPIQACQELAFVWLCIRLIMIIVEASATHV